MCILKSLYIVFLCRCLILRANGELSLLDLIDGRERELTDSIELFWVTCGRSGDKTNLIEEVSWLDYGHRGMQVTALIDKKVLWFFYFILDVYVIYLLFTGLVSIFRCRPL